MYATLLQRLFDVVTTLIQRCHYVNKTLLYDVVTTFIRRYHHVQKTFLLRFYIVLATFIRRSCDITTTFFRSSLNVSATSPKRSYNVSTTSQWRSHDDACIKIRLFFYSCIFSQWHNADIRLNKHGCRRAADLLFGTGLQSGLQPLRPRLRPGSAVWRAASSMFRFGLASPGPVRPLR